MLVWLILQNTRCLFDFFLVLKTCGCWITEPPTQVIRAMRQWLYIPVFGGFQGHWQWVFERVSSLAGNSLTSSIEKKTSGNSEEQFPPLFEQLSGEHKKGGSEKNTSTWGSSQPLDWPKCKNLSGIPNPPVHNLLVSHEKKNTMTFHDIY